MPKGIYKRKKIKKKAHRANASRPASKKKRRGRPPGSKNKKKTAAKRTASPKRAAPTRRIKAKADAPRPKRGRPAKTGDIRIAEQIVNALNNIADAVREAGGLAGLTLTERAAGSAERAGAQVAPPDTEDQAGASDAAPVS